MNFKDALKYLAAILLVGAIGWILYEQGAFAAVRNISASEYFVTLLILFLGYLISGFQIYFLLKRQSHVSLNVVDTTLLPFSMNIFGYLIPTNGGMLFSILFLKAKYRVDFTQSIAVSFGLVFVMLTLNGAIGLFFCFTSSLGVLFFAGSSLLLLSPLLAWILAKILSVLPAGAHTWIFKLKAFIQDALRQSIVLIGQKRIFTTMTAATLTIILLNIAAYYWLNLILGTGMSLAASAMTILLLNISSLVRIVPGNLGVEEILASGIFSLAGSDPATGALVTFLMRAVNLSLTIPLGILHTALNYQLIARPLLEWKKKK